MFDFDLILGLFFTFLDPNGIFLGSMWGSKTVFGSTHGQEVPEMILLLNDHKGWSGKGVVPTRPVVSGNKGINTHLSELLSEILEPISYTMGGGDILSTEEALEKITNINDCILKHENVDSLNAFSQFGIVEPELNTQPKSIN